MKRDRKWLRLGDVGIFEPVGDVEVGLLRGKLFMCMVWERGPCHLCGSFSCAFRDLVCFS